MAQSVAAPAAAERENRPWYRQLNGYHWLVLVVCTLAWLFDCLNQQIFNLTRKPAMADLLHVAPGDKAVASFGGWSTSMLLIGWATGGIFFGILGDRIGRVKTLVFMILAYSVSTGLCGLARGPWDYILFCFITGVGAGGIFPVGCTLVAESLPDRTRSQALGMLQAFSALGNVSAGFISLFMIQLWSQGVIASQWRWMFSVGVMPSLLSVIVARKLREPEVWKKAVAEGKATKRAGSLVELFSDPRWRRRAIVGLLLAASGVIGLWGIGVFSNDLTQSFIGDQFDQAARDKGEAEKDLAFVAQAITNPEQLDAAKRDQLEAAIPAGKRRQGSGCGGSLCRRAETSGGGQDGLAPECSDSARSSRQGWQVAEHGRASTADRAVEDFRRLWKFIFGPYRPYLTRGRRHAVSKYCSGPP